MRANQVRKVVMLIIVISVAFTLGYWISQAVNFAEVGGNDRIEQRVLGKDEDGTDTQRKQPDQTQSSLRYDTAKIAIIPWDKSKYLFDNQDYMPVTLVQEDLAEIDSLIVVCASDYNKDLHLPGSFQIDLKGKEYKRQFVSVLNSRGEKVVWVNCLCQTRGNSWKTAVILVDDGGPCFFNLKLNLSKKTFYELTVNGSA